MNDLPPRPTAIRWRIVALLLAFSFMSWFNRVSLVVAYDERIHAESAISEQEIGAVYSALLFAYMIFMVPGGWFADRWGPRLALVVMGFGSAFFVGLTGVVGLFAFSASLLFVLLLAIRVGMGVFTAPIYPSSARIVAHWLPFQQRSSVNGMVTAAAVIGNASTFIGFGMLMDWLGWPSAFLVAAGVTAFVALLWTLYAADNPSRHSGVNEAERALIVRSEPEVTAIAVGGSGHEPSLLRNRSLICLTLSYAAVGYFQYLFFFWSHYYFEDVLKVGKDESRVNAMILNLAMAAGMLVGGTVSDRITTWWGRRPGRATVATGGMLAGAVFLGLGIVAASPVWIVTWLALAMAAVGASEGPFWTTAVELGGRRGAMSASIFNTGGNAGGVLAPILTPFVSQHFGWPAGIALGGLVCLAGASLWLWIRPPRSGRGSAATLVVTGK